MFVSVRDFFGLSENYSWNDLDLAVNNKRQQIQNSNFNNIDKQVYFEQIDRYYRTAKNDLTVRERGLNQYNIIPWGSKQLGMRNWLWDGVDYIDRVERCLNNRFFNDINNKNISSNSSYSQNSYREILQNDGSSIVIEENVVRNGDKSQKNNVSYRKFSDGKREPLEYNEALNLFKNSNQNMLH